MTPCSLDPWISDGPVPIHAAELLPAPTSAAAMDRALQFLSRTDVEGSAFVIVRLPRRDDERSRALDAIVRSALAPRICVSVDSSSLHEVQDQVRNGDGVALMLDEVDAQTPPADFIRGSLNAVRFRADFVARAARDVRHGCALSAMLALARDLGLATLGPVTAPNEDWLVPGTQFDYVPVYSAESRADAARPARRAAAPQGRAFHLSR